MSQENTMLVIILLVSFGFLLGRLSLTRKNSRMKKENQGMRNLLYHLSAMENLSSQMFYSMAQEFIRKEKPKSLSYRKRK